jgi:ribosome production factor 1
MAGPMPDGMKPKNKLRRQSAYQKLKQTQEAAKRDLRFKRKREEAKNPALRAERLARNKPVTIDDKRVYDDDNLGDEGDALGWAIDVERQAKKRRLEQEAEQAGEGENGEDGLLAKLKKRDEEEEAEEEEDEVDSMLNSDSEAEELDSDEEEDIQSTKPKKGSNATERASSPASTATKPEISSDYLKQKFSAVYNAFPNPKTLVTTSINSTLHHEAEILCKLYLTMPLSFSPI